MISVEAILVGRIYSSAAKRFHASFYRYNRSNVAVAN